MTASVVSHEGGRDASLEIVDVEGSVTENIDTTIPAGRMMMQMVGSFAEFERAMIRERTSAGVAAARAEGRVGGQRPTLTEAQRRGAVRADGGAA